MGEHEERIWYAALKAKDARFDGHFFVGVSSTGIYCRPICRAKLPKPENCTFYTTAAAAEFMPIARNIAASLNACCFGT